MKCKPTLPHDWNLLFMVRPGLAAIVFAMLLATVSILAPMTADAQRRAALVSVDEVIKEPLRQSQPIQGRFIAKQEGTVPARTRGTVMEVHAFVGDRVSKGDPIATLDTDRLTAEANRRRAEVAYRAAQVDGSQARHKQASQELNRIRKLRRSAAFSQAKLDEQTNKLISAESEIAQYQALLATAEAELALAEIDLAYSVIRAPYDGIVTNRYKQKGTYVANGEPIVDLVDIGSLEIEVDVPASRIQGLTVGEVVAVETGAGQHYQATIRAVLPKENSLTRTRTVRLAPSFNPAETGAASGGAVTVSVPIGAKEPVLTVHKDAIIQRGGPVAFVVKEGKAMMQPVTLGQSTGSRFVVQNGLAQGDSVIIRGNERLRPGQPVRIAGAAPAKQSEPAKKPPAASEAEGKKKDADS